MFRFSGSNSSFEGIPVYGYLLHSFGISLSQLKIIKMDKNGALGFRCPNWIS